LVADGEKLILLQDAIRDVDKHKPDRERPLGVNVIDQAQNSETVKVPKQEEDLSKVLSGVVGLMPFTLNLS